MKKRYKKENRMKYTLSARVREKKEIRTLYTYLGLAKKESIEVWTRKSVELEEGEAYLLMENWNKDVFHSLICKLFGKDVRHFQLEDGIATSYVEASEIKS